jgi:hypothetical protein
VKTTRNLCQYSRDLALDINPGPLDNNYGLLDGEISDSYISK